MVIHNECSVIRRLFETELVHHRQLKCSSLVRLVSMPKGYRFICKTRPLGKSTRLNTGKQAMRHSLAGCEISPALKSHVRCLVSPRGPR